MYARTHANTHTYTKEKRGKKTRKTEKRGGEKKEKGRVMGLGG